MFFRLAKAGFSQKRKQLHNALSAGMHWSPKYGETILSNAEIDPKRRAETISIQEWQILTEIVLRESDDNKSN
jgi:16S rRNA (adenine1518-N6/adenine1519-N6)-dimethyltransferase